METPTQFGIPLGPGKEPTPRFTLTKYAENTDSFLCFSWFSFQAILVTGVVVEQYSWSSGFAAQLGIMLNSSDWIEVRGEVQVCAYSQPCFSF